MNTNLDKLSPEELGELFPIEVVPYREEWLAFFEDEKQLLINVLRGIGMLNIEHIGSTSVAGLAAKPIIDLLVEVKKLDEEIKALIISKMQEAGYGNMSNSEKEKSMEFGKGYAPSGFCGQTYHAHFREKNADFQDEIYFRNYLRRNDNARDAYAKLKFSLAEKHKQNREAYTQAKTQFIKEMTELAKMPES
ncbi:MAG: GrpB family protein [Dysgonamonadaceae bacterium]|jgi:GrpB-like predicted nucleotidyltransferase (UPF0157 family)|nr:GrpB family protein [Dysgonamonadaceae bacterium]